MIIDSHAHLEMAEFDPDRDEILQRAVAAGVEFVLTIGTAEPDKDSLEKALAICHHYPALATTVGVHPHEARIASAAWYRRLLELARDDKVWAIGEIGLDYHYDFSPRDVQRRVFVDQLVMARELDLPVVIHSREAAADTLEILRQHWSPPHPGGIMHCFSGDAAMAQQCLGLGFYISFAGPITFPKADKTRAAAAAIPEERLLAETDCPYLAPQSHRGKRNEPALVHEVVASLAVARGVTFAQMAAATTANFKKLFGKHFAK